MADSDRRYYRSRDDRVFAGVCGGLAEYLNVDPVLVRVVWVVVTIATFSLGAIAYLLLWLLAPEQPPGSLPSDSPPAKAAREPKVERKMVAPEADRVEGPGNG